MNIKMVYVLYALIIFSLPFSSVHQPVVGVFARGQCGVEAQMEDVSLIPSPVNKNPVRKT